MRKLCRSRHASRITRGGAEGSIVAEECLDSSFILKCNFLSSFDIFTYAHSFLVGNISSSSMISMIFRICSIPKWSIEFIFFNKNMEDLRSLMACIDAISSKIPDGLYLEMANKMKRVHDHMNGNKAFHEDTFYYSDDDSELESEEDDDSDYEAPWILTAQDQRLRVEEERMRDIRKLKDEIVGLVKQMHAEYKNLVKFDKVTTSTYSGIKRMTVRHKSEAIKAWCERMASMAGQHRLVGCVSSIAATEDGGWTWKNLMEWGLRTIVMEIGTDDEIDNAKTNKFFFDELSLKTLQKLPAFEKKIYDDYKEECHRKWNSNVEDAEKKVRESEKKMDTLEKACIEREYVLGDNNVEREWRDFWSIDRNVFTTGRTIL